MHLLDLLTGAWALQLEKLLELQAIYATHMRGEKIDLEALEARLGRPLANEQQAYTMHDGGIAVLPIEGVVAPKANLFMRISGGASTQQLQKQVESAMVDARVRGMVLAIDSPGGSVFGTPELAAAIHKMAKEKPIVAVCNEGTMASAAYWFASAANRVFISGPTCMVGSIGIVANHVYNPNEAVGRTEITAGKYKRIASSNAPLTKEGREHLQAQVDYTYSVFVDAVADYRGASVETVLEHMADGRVFIGQQALDAGLVDGVSTVDAIVEQMAADPDAFASRRKAKVKVPEATSQDAGDASREPTPPISQETQMELTKEKVAADHPTIAEAFRAEGRQAGKEEGLKAGAEGERKRIQEIEAQAMPGHEKLVAELKFKPEATAGSVAQAIVAAERTAREAQAVALAGGAPKPVDAGATAAKVPVAESEQSYGEARAAQHQKALDYQAAHPGTTYEAALAATGAK